MESYKEMNGNKKVWTNDAYFQKAKRPKLRAVRISKIAIFFKRLNAQF
ncbi:acetolactate synthase [Vibrio tasmaniensis]|uniref:Acetolactate synthase n=1 Tax=Vibrio tasmaniensis TaxID=212663 RepID=A0A2N7NK60_9VIBR|nr:acetolactate synthase [Vibrio tasmaniensis 1F-187]PMP15333.1 acetolactate synthase [Vibrio tasmaniensis]TKG31875.1 acetolactate synthase [Vibrio tasmaniensis]TKG41933.1 acetolactate synthase [Vibrio tasmaniensis]TKG47776.1 acetolactate synthase [Vibrio tasmaniensis]